MPVRALTKCKLLLEACHVDVSLRILILENLIHKLGNVGVYDIVAKMLYIVLQ